MLSRPNLLGLSILGFSLYVIFTIHPRPRDTFSYCVAKLAGALASVCIGILLITYSGTTNFWALALAVLIGQIAFKMIEMRIDRRAQIYC